MNATTIMLRYPIIPILSSKGIFSLRNISNITEKQSSPYFMQMKPSKNIQTTNIATFYHTTLLLVYTFVLTLSRVEAYKGTFLRTVRWIDFPKMHYSSFALTTSNQQRNYSKTSPKTSFILKEMTTCKIFTYLASVITKLFATRHFPGGLPI